MSCSKAYEYFMNLMDNSLSIMESEWLERHVSICEKCREDFMAYEAVLNALEDDSVIEAPDDLEERVMAQINEMASADKIAGKITKRKLIATGVAFAVLATLSSFYLIGIDRIIVVFENSQLQIYTELLGTAADHALVFILNAGILLSSFGAATYVFFDRFSYLLLFVVAFLVILQLALWRKERIVGGVR